MAQNNGWAKGSCGSYDFGRSTPGCTSGTCLRIRGPFNKCSTLHWGYVYSSTDITLYDTLWMDIDIGTNWVDGTDYCEVRYSYGDNPDAENSQILIRISTSDESRHTFSKRGQYLTGVTGEHKVWIYLVNDGDDNDYCYFDNVELNGNIAPIHQQTPNPTNRPSSTTIPQQTPSPTIDPSMNNDKSLIFSTVLQCGDDIYITGNDYVSMIFVVYMQYDGDLTFDVSANDEIASIEALNSTYRVLVNDDEHDVTLELFAIKRGNYTFKMVVEASISGVFNVKISCSKCGNVSEAKRKFSNAIKIALLCSMAFICCLSCVCISRRSAFVSAAKKRYTDNSNVTNTATGATDDIVLTTIIKSKKIATNIQTQDEIVVHRGEQEKHEANVYKYEDVSDSSSASSGLYGRGHKSRDGDHSVTRNASDDFLSNLGIH
eukprot:137512_1